MAPSPRDPHRGQPVRALRSVMSAKLGWELQPADRVMPALYDAIWDAGRRSGSRTMGCTRFNTCGSTKANKGFGHRTERNELTSWKRNARFIHFDRTDFVGKPDARQSRVHEIVYGSGGEPTRRARREPVLVKDRCIGVTPRRLRAPRQEELAIACVDPDFAAPEPRSTCSSKVSATPQRCWKPAFDPDNLG